MNTFRDLVANEEDEESIDTDIDEDEDNPDYVDEVDYKTQTEDEDEEYVPDDDGESEDDESYNPEDGSSGEEDDVDDRKGDDKNGNMLLQVGNGGTRSMTNSTSRKNIVKDIQLELCPEARKDKIFYMEFGQWATEFTRKYSTQKQAFQVVISQLNEVDRHILKRIVC